ncbi:MAG TPA: hypothetical protein DCY27_04155 [Desulfobacterales bacterium]|jgi:hypothetical protein|nr:hypothetical protein [Desulfobacterales bacterium]
MHKRKAICISTLVLIVAMNTDAPAEPPVITIDGTAITYEGNLSEKNIDLFLEMAKGRKIETLVINSGGGDITAGMELGSWVFKGNIDVVVEGICMSSCANYVFTAGHHKTITNGSIVGWHGNALQESGKSDNDVREAVTRSFNSLSEEERKKLNLEELVGKSIEQMRGYLVATKKRQADFFTKIGVDEYVCRVGNEKYGAVDFFILSVEDMGRFGIGNVQAPENYEKIDLTPYHNKGKKIQYIKLKDD